MTLGELLFDLEEPDWVPDELNAMNLEVQFCTKDGSVHELLSVYYAPESGMICIDIGGEGD